MFYQASTLPSLPKPDFSQLRKIEDEDEEEEFEKENINTEQVRKRSFRELEELSQSGDEVEFKKRAKKLVPSPSKYYPFKRVGGRIRAQMTPSARKKRRVTYKIKRTDTGESYSGKTAQLFPDRVYGHHYGINHPERDAGDKELYRDIRENPELFVIGIQMEQEDAGISLELLEKICIAANDSFEEGYNQDRGGGGGTAAVTPPSSPTKAPPSTPPRTPILTKEQARTPQKGYDVDWDVDERIRVFISPKAKKTRSVIYGFKNTETEEWLIGETEQKVGDRVSGYHYAFNNPKRDVGKLPLPVAVRLAPEDFKFYILQESPDDPKAWEKAWIKAKDAFESGYNQNRGGGGSTAI